MESAIQTIKSHYSALRPSERKVADHILLCPEHCRYLTLAALAEEAKVSEPTVLRFVRAVGYTNLLELRGALAGDSVLREPLAELCIKPGDRPEALPEKLTAVAKEALDDTLQTLDRTHFTRAVEAIASARLVDLYAVGNSGAVATDLATKLLRIGCPCRFHPDSHLQQLGACALGPGDVAVGISHSGATRDTVDALRLARERGAVTVAITNFKGAGILEWGDFALVTGDVETGFHTETMLSRISQLAIVDSLYMALILRDYELRTAALNRVNEMVGRKVY